MEVPKIPREAQRIYTADECRDRIREADRRCKISTSVPGLHLYIKGPSGAQTFSKGTGSGFWTGQFYLGGNWNSRGLGAYPAVSFADAKREWAKLRVNFLDADKLPPARHGRRVLRASSTITATIGPAAGKSFKEVAAAWLPTARANAKRPWTEKTAKGREAALLRLPFAGKDINAITDDDVLDALQEKKIKGHREQAERIRQDVARVLDYAIGKEFRTGHNPAKFDTDARRQLYKKPPKDDDAHHAAVAWKDLPDVYKALPDTVAGKALKFTLLTAERSGDTEQATWSQVENENGSSAWIIPKTKTGQPLRVPLAPQALELLGGKRGEPSTPLFDLKSNQMLNTLQKVQPNMTVHGLRSSFRDWCAEHGHDRELAEMSLAHKVGSKVERAYRRTDLLERRRALMNEWAKFVTGRD